MYYIRGDKSKRVSYFNEEVYRGSWEGVKDVNKIEVIGAISQYNKGDREEMGEPGVDNIGGKHNRMDELNKTLLLFWYINKLLICEFEKKNKKFVLKPNCKQQKRHICFGSFCIDKICYFLIYLCTISIIIQKINSSPQSPFLLLFSFLQLLLTKIILQFFLLPFFYFFIYHSL